MSVRASQSIRTFGAFWWDFIVGDDWRIAAGVILALAATAAVATTSVAAWWIVPLAITGLLWMSLTRATQPNPPPPPTSPNSNGSTS